jgi:hypothetical protein
LVIPNERLTTQLGGKMAPARRVAAKKAPLVVAYMDVGQEREQDAISFALHLFGATKPRSARLDWHFFSHNADNPIGVNRP